MTAETDLLPLPEPGMLHVGEPREWFTADQMHAYARANVAHAIAPLQAEIETLLAELDIRDSIIATHAADTREYQKRISQAEARAEQLAEALRHQRWCRTCAEDGWESCEEGRKNDALLRDQDEGR
jgi:hypothetical protein